MAGGGDGAGVERGRMTQAQAMVVAYLGMILAVSSFLRAALAD
jgi:hypothetical protein